MALFSSLTRPSERSRRETVPPPLFWIAWTAAFATPAGCVLGWLVAAVMDGAR